MSMYKVGIDIQEQSTSIHIPVFPIRTTVNIRDTKQFRRLILVKMSLRKTYNMKKRKLVLYAANFISYAPNIEVQYR